MTNLPQRCLVIGPSWVGDMMMAQSLFIALKQQFPSLLIDVLAPAWSLPLLAVMPQVNAGIELPFAHGELDLKRRYQLGRSLRANGYDWAIVLPNSFKSALIPFWAKIPRRTGYNGELRYGLLNDRRQLDKARLTMTVQRFVALAYPPDIPQPPLFDNPAISLTSEQLRIVQTKFQLNPDRPLLALCPGAEYGAAKRWPADYFAIVAKHMLARGWQVILVGSNKDRAITQDIAQQVDNPALHNLAGVTTLLEALTLLALARKVVSNDSGLMHMAAAVGVPVLALYGSSDPGFTPPLHASAQIMWLALECSPCFKRECPMGHLDCLMQLLPNQVLAKLM